MNEQTKTQISQLKLVAALLETNHPWEWRASNNVWVKNETSDPMAFLFSGYEIRPVLVTPDDGRKLNNPDNLTAEQVGVGYKLTLKEQMDGKKHEEGEFWKADKWKKPDDYFGWSWLKNDTIRIPLSTPWPKAKPIDPYTELKKAHAEGKEIETNWGDWSLNQYPDWTLPPEKYRIKPWTLPEPPKLKWHLAHLFKEGMMKKGERPLLEGEKLEKGDFFKTSASSTSLVDGLAGYSTSDRELNDAIVWTSRPLPF